MMCFHGYCQGGVQARAGRDSLDGPLFGDGSQTPRSDGSATVGIEG